MLCCFLVRLISPYRDFIQGSGEGSMISASAWYGSGAGTAMEGGGSFDLYS